MAQNTGRPFLGVWLDAAPARLRQRVDERRGGPSDATVDVLEKQLGRNIAYMDWERIDADRDLKTIVEDVLSRLEPLGPSAR